MQRFYFDLVGDVKVHDRQGVSLPGDGAARDYAKMLARELILEKTKLLGKPVAEWSLRVSNERFEPVFDLPFAALADNLPIAASAIDQEDVTFEALPVPGH
jgi:Domain of unknown function (DUF6894)